MEVGRGMKRLDGLRKIELGFLSKTNDRHHGQNLSGNFVPILDKVNNFTSYFSNNQSITVTAQFIMPNLENIGS